MKKRITAFCLVCFSIFLNAQEIDLVGSFPKCNSLGNMWITFTNTDSIPRSGIIELQLADSLSFVSSIPAPDSSVNNTYYWHYDSLASLAWQQVNLIVNIPDSNNIGLDLISTVKSHVFDTNNLIIKSIDNSLIQQITCVYDPNDKLVEPVGLSNKGYVGNDQLFEYTVRFQNTGNDTATQVIIIDQLSPNLDLTTLRILGSSHPYILDIQPTARLVFTFDSILLPDSMLNFSASQGFLKFLIKALPNLPVETEIKNSAEIYFDLNPVILTNEVLNTIFNCDSMDAIISGEHDSICKGESLALTNNSKFVESYEWYLNGNLVSSAPSYLHDFQSELDTLILISKNKMCQKTDTLLVDTLFLPPLVDLMLTDTIGFCNDPSVNLQSNYLSGNEWFYNGMSFSDDSIIMANQFGVFTLIVNENGCFGKDSVYIKNNSPKASISANGLTDSIVSFCNLDSLWLHSEHIGGNAWYSAGNLISNLDSVQVSSEGSYLLEVSDGGCQSIDSVQVGITLKLAELYIIDYTIFAQLVGGYQYAWLDCWYDTIISGETSYYYQIQGWGGQFAAIVSYKGCKDTTSCIYFSAENVNEIGQQDQLNVYPNPVTNLLTIQSNASGILQKLELFDSEGRKLQEKTVSAQLVNWNLEAEERGIYFLRIHSDQGIVNRKIVLE